MKRIYLAVLIVLMLSAALFASSIFYLDREKHKSYRFLVTSDGVETGTVKIDKFVTDDNIFYKSSSLFPFEPMLSDTKSRLVLDKRYGLVSYLKEDSGGGIENTVYLENTNNNISFVGTSMSEFAALTDLPVKRNTFVFEESSPMTYLPILENYDFSIGRAQAFSVLTVPSALLPPMKRLLTLTSIRDEYMKVNSRKIKVECLLIRMKNLPQGMLFVTKTGRSLVCIEFPDRKLKIMRTFEDKALKAEPLALKSGACADEEVKFNDKKIALSGTLTVPSKGEKHPAVLLVGGREESDREEQGLFTYLANALGNSGYVVLRFDRRGIGSSSGNSLSVTDTESFNDVVAALTYLSGRKEVDPARIALIGHGKGAFYAAKIAAENKTLRTIILMAPSMALSGQADLNFDNLNEMAARHNWDDQYLKLSIKSRIETIDKVKGAKRDWIALVKRRCFVRSIKEELEQNTTDIIRKVECPVLILHGKEDETVLSKDAAGLDKTLEESGNKNHNLIYYGYLGHFFGKAVNDGTHKAYYEADPAVVDTVKKWLEINS
jgi:alpha-beta hydrolase superfamily lysophospholipase